MLNLLGPVIQSAHQHKYRSAIFPMYSSFNDEHDVAYD